MWGEVARELGETMGSPEILSKENGVPAENV
jgi:hypothetical protein